MNRLISFLFLIGPLNLMAQNNPTTVAVVDMGIDYYKIPELKTYMVSPPNHQRGWDFGANEASLGIDYSFKHEGEYHGTFIAFLITRPQYPNTQRIKLLDVVYSDYYGNLFQLNKYMFPENNLQVYRRLRAYKNFSKHLSETFHYSEQMGARVINFSSSDRGFNSEELENYLKEAKKRGTFLVVSAGNDGSNLDEWPQYPCSYNLENVICVGAVNSKNQKTSYSNYGKSVDIFAVGNFGSFEGTSFSTPLISRALALIINKHPHWSISQIRRELFSYVTVDKKLPIFNLKKFHQVYF